MEKKNVPRLGLAVQCLNRAKDKQAGADRRSEGGAKKKE